MTYYIRHNEKPKGQADFYILHDVGAIQENDRQQGLAHFLEHMAFNGTKNLPGKQLIEYLETVGVKFGRNLNAGTSWDQTTYLIKDVPVVREGVVDSDPARLVALHRPAPRGDRLGARRDHGGAAHARRRLVALDDQDAAGRGPRHEVRRA